MLPLATAIRKVERLAYSPDGTRLAASGPAGTEVLDLASGETVALLAWANDVVAFRPDGNSLLVAYDRRGIAVVNLNRPVLRPLHYGESLSSHFVLLLPDTDEILIGHADRVSKYRFHLGRTISVSDQENWCRWSMPSSDQVVRTMCLAICGDLLRIITIITMRGEAVNHCYIINSDTGELIRRHRCGYSSLNHFTGSPCGQWLVGVKQNSLVVWDANRLDRPPRRLLNDTPKQFTGLAFVPDGRHLLTTSNDKSVKAWDLEAGQVVRSYDFAVGRTRSVAVAPDGLTAAAGSDESLVVLFDLDL